MRNATPVLPFKTRRPTRRHYFLRVNFRPFSFFTRTTHAKIFLKPSAIYSDRLPINSQYGCSMLMEQHIVNVNNPKHIYLETMTKTSFKYRRVEHCNITNQVEQLQHEQHPRHIAHQIVQTQYHRDSSRSHQLNYKCDYTKTVQLH